MMGNQSLELFPTSLTSATSTTVNHIPYTIDQVANAISCILNPSSNIADRTAAHTLCDQIKESAQAPQYGFQLAQSTGYPLAVRLFGLNILEEYVRTRMRLEEAIGLRDGFWSLLTLVVGVVPGERRLIQEKCAMLIAQLALRIWPQYWPDFFDRLLELIEVDGLVKSLDAFDHTNTGGGNTITTTTTTNNTAAVRTEMGLLMARLVVDEIHPKENIGAGRELASTCFIWDEGRRPELQRALSLVLPTIVDRLYQLLPWAAQLLYHVESNLSTRSSPTESMAMIILRASPRLVLTILDAWGSLTWWVPLKESGTIASIMAILQIIAHRLPRAPDELLDGALETLMTFGGRPSKPAEVELYQQLFDKIVNPWGQLLASLASRIDSGISEEHYESLRKLAEAWITLVTTHLGHYRKTITIDPTQIGTIIDLMFSLARLDSLLVSGAVDWFWAAIGKNERFVKQPAFIDRLPAIFLHCLVTLAQDKTESRRHLLNRYDFDEDDGETTGSGGGGEDVNKSKVGEADFDAIWVAHHSKIMDLLKQLACHHPVLLANYCANAIQSFLGELAERMGKGSASLLLASSLEGTSLRQWDALMHTTDSVLKACHLRLFSSSSNGNSDDAGGEANADLTSSSPQSKQAIVEAIERIAILLGESTLASPLQIHPSTLCLWFVAIRMLMPCLAASASLGETVTGNGTSSCFSSLMQRLFELALEYRVPEATNEVSSIKSDLTAQEKMEYAIRARATTAILRTVHAHPSVFVPAIDYLVGLFRARTMENSLESNLNFDEVERLRQVRMLTEVLLVVTGAMEGATQRQELVKLILGPLLTRVTLVHRGPFNSPNAFIQSLGITMNSLENRSLTPGYSEQVPRQWKLTISGLQSWLWITMKELKKLMMAGDIKGLINNQMIPTIVPFLIQGIQLVHNLYVTPEMMGLIGGEDEMVSNVTAATTGSDGRLVDGGNQGSLPTVEKAIDGELMMDSAEGISRRTIGGWRGWFYMVRVMLYMVLGQTWSLAPALMFNEPFPMTLLLKGTESMNNNEMGQGFSITQWTLLLKHLIQPILMTAASTNGGGGGINHMNLKSTVIPLLMVVMEEWGGRRLNIAWQQLQQVQEQQKTLENHLAAQEMAREALLSTATTTLLGLLYDLALPLGERDKKTDPIFDIAMLRSNEGVGAGTGVGVGTVMGMGMGMGMGINTNKTTTDTATITTPDTLPTNNVVALLIFRNEEGVQRLTDTLLELLMAMLRWKMNLTLSKVIAIINRWLPVLMMNGVSPRWKRPQQLKSPNGKAQSLVGRHHQILFGGLPNYLFKALSSTAMVETHPAILQLITELWKWQLWFGYEFMDEAITGMGLPLVTGKPIALLLREYFLTISLPVTIKAQRNQVKATLVKAIQQQALSAVGVTSTLPKLPDKLVFLRKATKVESGERDEDGNLDLASLFG